jgi:hypothetical protein
MPQITLLIFPLSVIISSLGNSHNNFSPWIHIHSVIHISHQKYIKSWNLTRKHRCESPTSNRSSTRAPLLLLLHHVFGPSCKSQVYLINFPHSRICFIITISTTNKSFFQSFLSALCFSHFTHYYCRSLSNPSYHSFLYIWTITVQLLLSRFWIVTVWPLLRFLTISGVIELRFKQNLWLWKGKTWGYKFYVLRRTQFCL